MKVYVVQIMNEGSVIGETIDTIFATHTAANTHAAQLTLEHPDCDVLVSEHEVI